VTTLLQHKQRGIYSLEWVYPFLKSAVTNVHILEELSSPDCLSSLLDLIRQHYNRAKAVDVLCAVVSTPAKKELLWKLGGIDVLLDHGFVARVSEMFPLHSQEALLDLSRCGAKRGEILLAKTGNKQAYLELMALVGEGFIRYTQIVDAAAVHNAS
jgi:hypothetical protein